MLINLNTAIQALQSHDGIGSKEEAIKVLEGLRPRQRCQAQIHKRDTYRRTGHGRTGFEMHYNKCQCSRAAVEDGRCKQHAHGKGYINYKHANEFMDETP
jgi:hypothetical protein